MNLGQTPAYVSTVLLLFLILVSAQGHLVINPALSYHKAWALFTSTSSTRLGSVSVTRSAERSLGIQCIVMISLVATRATFVSNMTVCKHNVQSAQAKVS